MELPTFEENGPQDQTTRATIVFEVWNIKGSTRIHPALFSMEENVVQWFNIWQKKFKNPSWEHYSKALSRSFGGREHGILKSLGTENATPLLKNGQQLDNKKGWLQEWVLHRKAFCGYKMRNRIFGTRPRVSEEETLTLDLDNWGCS